MNSHILLHVSTIHIPATTTQFVADKHFVVDASEKKGVQFSAFNAPFIKMFLDGRVNKVEEPAPANSLCRYRLTARTKDLGLRERPVTKLRQVFHLLRKQPKGEKSGELNAYGGANLFEVQDWEYFRCGIVVYWFPDGWYVGARSLSGLYWSAGSHVFEGVVARAA